MRNVLCAVALTATLFVSGCSDQAASSFSPIASAHAYAPPFLHVGGKYSAVITPGIEIKITVSEVDKDSGWIKGHATSKGNRLRPDEDFGEIWLNLSQAIFIKAEAAAP